MTEISRAAVTRS